jgi:hypothetical protein
LLFRFLEGKPCPQYVPGGVDVGVGPVAACETSELRLGHAITCRSVTALIAAYKDIRPVIQRGRLYRLASVLQGPFGASEYVAGDDGVVLA